MGLKQTNFESIKSVNGLLYDFQEKNFPSGVTLANQAIALQTDLDSLSALTSSIYLDLGSTTANLGASIVSINDTDNVFTATDVEGALLEVKAIADANQAGVGARWTLVKAEIEEGNLTSFTEAGSGVGKTITADANGAFDHQSLTWSTGDRILLSHDVDGVGIPETIHGIYELTSVGDAGNPWVLTRAADADEDDDFVPNKTVYIAEGNVAGYTYQLVTPEVHTIDTTPLAFDLISTSPLTEGSVTTSKLADAAVTNNKIDDATISESKLDSLTQAKLAKNDFITVTQAVNLDDIESELDQAKTDITLIENKTNNITVTQAVDLDAMESDISTNASDIDAIELKTDFITITQPVNLDNIEGSLTGLTQVQNDVDAIETKTDFITVTQAVDLDSMESDIAAKQDVISGGDGIDVSNDEVSVDLTAGADVRPAMTSNSGNIRTNSSGSNATSLEFRDSNLGSETIALLPSGSFKATDDNGDVWEFDYTGVAFGNMLTGINNVRKNSAPIADISTFDHAGFGGGHPVASAPYYQVEPNAFLEFESGKLKVSTLDEDNLASDSASHVPTQQSVKAYVDVVKSDVSAIETKTDLITVTQAIDLDNLDSSLTGLTQVQNEVDAIEAKTDFITVTQAVNLDDMEVDIINAQSNITNILGKTQHITVTQAVDLDSMESDIAANASDIDAIEVKTDLITVSAATNLDAVSALASGAVPSSEKGSNNGVATLDGSGQIPISQLPNTVMELKGSWDPNLNTPTLADGSGDVGDVYIVSNAGSIDLGSGSLDFASGDEVIYDGSVWIKKESNTNLTNAEVKLAYEANADTNAFTDAYQTKLDGIEANATADMTGAEIKVAYEAEADTNAFTDAAKAKNDFITVSAATDLDLLKSDLDTAEAAIDAIEVKTDFITITQPVNLDSIESGLGNAESDIDAIEVKTDLITVSAATDLDLLKSDLDTAEAAIDAIEVKTDYVTVTKAINLDTLDGTVSSNADAIIENSNKAVGTSKFAYVTLSHDSSATVDVGSILPANAMVIRSMVNVTSAFDGSATVNLGTDSNNTAAFTSVDLTDAATSQNGFVGYTEGSDFQMKGYYTAGGATTGTAILMVEFIEASY